MFNPCATHSLDTYTNNIHHSSYIYIIVWLLDILTYYLSNLRIDISDITENRNGVNLNLPRL